MTVKDARGQSVRPIRIRTLSRAAAAVDVTTAVLRLGLAAFVAYIGVCGVVGLVVLARGGRWSRLPLAAGMASSAVFAIWAMWRERSKSCAQRVTEALSQRRCGSCGYDLAALESEPDGCTVCPECGAAWRVSEGTTMP